MLTELKNGATLTGCVKEANGSGFVVLALAEGQLVCWRADEDGNCFWGEYGEAAWPSFIERVTRYCDINMRRARG